MNTLSFILQKEFKQIFRDKTILAMMFIAPIMQFIILPQVANFDVKNINLVYIDHDQSPYSQQLLQKITASGYFRLINAPFTYAEGITYIEKGKADVVVEIPTDFERNLVREGRQSIGVSIDAINGSKSSLGGAYLAQVIRDFNQQLAINIKAPKPLARTAQITMASTSWYNPLMQYKYYIVPGILAILLTIIGGFLSALNVVKEKEIGTIEQINVTPIKKWQFILGQAHTLLGIRYAAFHLGAYPDVCSLWHRPSGKFAHPIYLCCNVSYCHSWLWAAGFHLCQFAVASNVYRLFLYNDIPANERFPYQYREYARLGNDSIAIHSRYPLCKSNAPNCLERQCAMGIEGRAIIPYGLRSSAQQLGNLEL